MTLRTGRVRPFPSALPPAEPGGCPASGLSLGRALAGAGSHQSEAVGHGAGPATEGARGAGPSGGGGRRQGPAGRAAAESRDRQPHGGGGGRSQIRLRGQRGLRGHSPGAGGLFQPLRGDPAGHHPVRQVLRTPQGLCIHRVCHRELGPGRCGAGQERLPRPGPQGAAQKNQLTRDQLHGPRGPSGTPRRQGGTLPPQQLPGRGPFQTTGAKPVGRALGGRDPIGAAPGGRGSVGPGWVRWAEPWRQLAPRPLSGQGARKSLAVVFTVLKGGPDFESGAAAGSGGDSRAPRGTIYSAENSRPSPFPRREDGPTAEATGHEAGRGVGLARGLVGALERTGQSSGQVRPRQRWVSFGSAYSGLFR
ncbi:spidroin-2 isoform X4 [Physeter macrocephalus]|uniref:Spidroin-2 isoform X4 n=1 Tax=Physeter macrocephalus TaxID=9755 RepID=A0A455B1W2_PHYMC|nr:spidroin-2 isoform X4 [Physeter catodon]|eukprot:XP_028342757.1 spidroin-2 isoform X4 [Physeter catodon]